MLNKINISPKTLIIYITLILVVLAVYWQTNKYDFVNLDDIRYVTENSHIQSGISLEEVRWAFSTIHAEFWHPLTWLSLMFDYQIHGMNPGGYHLTNLILHVLSTLLLFWLFCRMTGAIWKSAFVAALFGLHPLHVESVAWISERKDVLSAFFWMLTLCLYVYYTEKPVIKRYLFIVFSFILALMSKPMVVALPAIMILLDYWPLNRFESHKDNLILWQLKEKLPFFILSAAISIITLYAQQNVSGKYFSLGSRIASASVSFTNYLDKIFWPHDLTVFYHASDQVTTWQVLISTILIIIVSTAVVFMVKRLPYLFVGWLWYAITLLPVIGIIPTGIHWIHDLYAYLPSIGITVGIVWCIPSMIRYEKTKIHILFPVAIIVCSVFAVLTWKQCAYWKNSSTLFNHNAQVTKNNFMVHNHLGLSMFNEGKIEKAVDHYNTAISINPRYAPVYHNRGNAYAKLGQYQYAIEDYDKAICLLKPVPAQFYMNRGNSYANLGKYQQAIEDFNQALNQEPGNADFYNNRSFVFVKLGRFQQALDDLNKAIDINHGAYSYINRGIIYTKRGLYQQALDDFNKAIKMNDDNANAYSCRGSVYFSQGDTGPGCYDARKACSLGDCRILEAARGKGYCR